MNNTSTRPLLRWLMPLAAVIGLLLVIAWMAGAFSQKIEPGTLEIGQQATSGEPHTVATIEVDVTEPVPAVVGAREATTISSRTLARITELLVRAGDTVEKGQVLIRLEQSDLESRLAQARQNETALKARLTEAKQSLERASQLYERDLVAAAMLDEARANHDALQAQLASAQQSAREAEVSLQFAEIRSPIDGRVVERFAEPGDTASPGTPLVSLYNPASIRIEAAVRESLSLPLSLGQKILVEIPALKQTRTGWIEERVPAANPGSRSFTVKLRVDDAAGLMPGMYARMLVPVGTEEWVVVPEELVVPFGQLDVTWVVSNGQLDRRFVRLGRKIEPRLREVLSGLEPGDQLSLPESP